MRVIRSGRPSGRAVRAGAAPATVGRRVSHGQAGGSLSGRRRRQCSTRSRSAPPEPQRRLAAEQPGERKLNTKKRLMALAVAGASAVVLGGAFGLSQHATHVSAAGPSAITEGCVTGNASNLIQFPLTITLSGAVGTPSYGTQSTTPTGAFSGFGA